MITEPSPFPTPLIEQGRIDALVSDGPAGALALAGVAVAIVVGMWFAFYFLVFLPRT
jgi:hypothetical protein